jgi:multidrug efflux system membrane fusion protein
MAPYSSPGKRPFPLKKWLIGAALGVAVFYGVPKLWGSGGAPGAPGMPPPGTPMPASVASVISKPVMLWTSFPGRIEAAHSAEIRPRVSGQITEVHFKDGEEVKRGEPLFTIDPRPFAAEVSRAEGALVAAESAALRASQDLARAQQLVKSKAISQSEFEQKSSASIQARGALASAKGALQAAELNLSYAHIAAPISGKISRAEMTVGNMVNAGINAPLLASIVTLAPIYASFELDEKSFLKTIQGVPAAKLKQIPVTVALANGAAIPAHIHAFDNQIAPGSGTLRVRAIIENKDGALVPGLFATVRMGTPEETASILVSPLAIATDQNKKFVLVVDAEGKAEYREVKPGVLVDGLQVVESGLAEGEKIVVEGLQRLKPGTPVIATMVDMTTLKPLDAPPAEVAQ